MNYELIIDEIGYLPISKQEASLLFQLIRLRHEVHSTILTPNIPFSKWEKFFRTVPLQQPFSTALSIIPEYSRWPETLIAWKTINWNASSFPRKKHRTILVDRPVKNDSTPLFFGWGRWNPTSATAEKRHFFNRCWHTSGWLTKSNGVKEKPIQRV